MTAFTNANDALVKFDEKAVPSDFESELSIENSNYKMEVDNSNFGIILTELSTGRIWKTSPDDVGNEKFDELGMPIKRHSLTESVISVTYLDKETNTETVIDSATGAAESGRIRAAKSDTSILLEFYFDGPKFMIPVEFILLEDSLQIRVNPSKIQEDENKVVAISLAPFFSSACNGIEGSYLFYPSGCGALISTDEVSNSGNTYSSEIYGTDAAMEKNVVFSNEKSVRLPCYGVVSEVGKGLFAIIDSGAESVELYATAGATTYGHSAVYPIFNVRGYTEHEATVYGSTRLTRKIFGEQKIKTSFSVRYFPLENEYADYSGMASIYREYLKAQNKISNANTERRLNVTLLGGTMIMKSFLGIPYKSIYPATTVKQAEKIINELGKSTGVALSAQLKGFGKTGTNAGKVGSGFEINSKLGNVKDFKSLKKTAERFNSDVYLDFEICRFNKSSLGFSTFFDSAYSAGEKVAAQYLYDKAVNSPIKDTLYYLLRPVKISDATGKAIKAEKKYGIGGISFGSLPSLAYSDYKNKNNSDFNSKSGFEKLVSDSFVKAQKSGIKTMSNDANICAAVKSDIISDVPLTSTRAYIFESDIPFYQMVFKGIIPIVSESINLSENPSLAVLRAIEAGCGLNYTLVYSSDTVLIDSEEPVFYNSRYSDLKNKIIEQIKQTSDFYDAVNGSEIRTHTVIGSLRKVEYENGVVVYVNYGNEAVQTESGNVNPCDYLVAGKG